MVRIAVLIDGGHLRVLARMSGHNPYDANYIEKVANACVDPSETPLRFLYYDCAPYVGKTKLPVSGKVHEFKGDDGWLKQLASKDLFAVRRGVLKFRGFKPANIPVSTAGLTDSDFRPDFEQKGVDMRIGLDIATFCQSRAVERIVLITGDTDCIPAMKHARIAGLQIVLVTFPTNDRRPSFFGILTSRGGSLGPHRLAGHRRAVPRLPVSTFAQGSSVKPSAAHRVEGKRWRPRLPPV